MTWNGFIITEGPLLPGHRNAMIHLKCSHTINPHQIMRLFRAKKGELRECPEGCGMQGIKEVRSFEQEKRIR